MEQLSGLDSMMVLGEIANVPLHMSALFIYDPSTSSTGKIDFKEVKTLVGNVIDKALPVLKCRTEKVAFSLDKPYWVEDENFNLNFHIQHFALPRPANWQALDELLGQFHAQPLNPNRPLWQALYIEGLDKLGDLPKGCVGMVMKIHHALADGKTAVKIFSELHTLSAEPGAPLIAEGMEDDLPDFSPPSSLDKLTRASWHLVSAPVKLWMGIAGIASNTLFSRKEYSTPSLPVPDTVFNRLPSADRKVGHMRMPIEVVKQLRNLSGATINEIAMCVIAGGLREYLGSRQQLPEHSLVTGMPINTRPKADTHNIGNNLSFANLSLFTDIENPRERLLAIHNASSLTKHNNERLGPNKLTEVTDNLYPGLVVWGGQKLVEFGLIEKLPRLNNTIISNVPGIQAPCYLAGAKLVEYLGMGPLAPTVSLFHLISSIYSHISICFQSCSGSLEDGDDYTRSLQHSYQQLLVAYELEADTPARKKKTKS